jgi:hypothetical protein
MANQQRKKVEQVLAPHEICPDGTKAWMLCLGYLEADDAFLIRCGCCLTLGREDPSDLTCLQWREYVSQEHGGRFFRQQATYPSHVLCSYRTSSGRPDPVRDWRWRGESLVYLHSTGAELERIMQNWPEMTGPVNDVLLVDAPISLSRKS